MKTFDLVVPCHFGLEAVTKREIYDHGYEITKARGARVVAIAKEGRTEIEQVADEVIYIPPCMDEVSPVLAVIPLQIFAYYVAKERGCNIDKPKNLAKSVTVE